MSVASDTSNACAHGVCVLSLLHTHDVSHPSHRPWVEGKTINLQES